MIFDWFIDVAQGLMQGILNILPGSWEPMLPQQAIDLLKAFYGLNWFLPVTEILQCTTLTMMVFATMWTVKLIKDGWEVLPGN